MENYWELEPTKVQVKIKDEKHLTELFKMCKLFGQKIGVDDYIKSLNWFRYTEWFSNYNFDDTYTEVTTEQFYEILCHNYGYQGGLKGFDKDVVLTMLYYREEQDNKRDIKVFENSPTGGFHWKDTEEGFEFWRCTVTVNKGRFPWRQQNPGTSQDLEKNYEKLYNELLEKFEQLLKSEQNGH